jgi:hypothetical protein
VGEGNLSQRLLHHHTVPLLCESSLGLSLNFQLGFLNRDLGFCSGVQVYARDQATLTGVDSQ